MKGGTVRYGVDVIFYSDIYTQYEHIKDYDISRLMVGTKKTYSLRDMLFKLLPQDKKNDKIIDSVFLTGYNNFIRIPHGINEGRECNFFRFTGKMDMLSEYILQMNINLRLLIMGVKVQAVGSQD